MLFLHPYEYEMLEYLDIREVPDRAGQEGPQAADAWMSGGYEALACRPGGQNILTCLLAGLRRFMPATRGHRRGKALINVYPAFWRRRRDR